MIVCSTSKLIWFNAYKNKIYLVHLVLVASSYRTIPFKKQRCPIIYHSLHKMFVFKTNLHKNLLSHFCQCWISENQIAKVCFKTIEICFGKKCNAPQNLFDECWKIIWKLYFKTGEKYFVNWINYNKLCLPKL